MDNIVRQIRFHDWQSAGNTTNIYIGGDVTGGNIISGEGNQTTVESEAKKKSAGKKS